MSKHDTEWGDDWKLYKDARRESEVTIHGNAPLSVDLRVPSKHIKEAQNMGLQLENFIRVIAENHLLSEYGIRTGTDEILIDQVQRGPTVQVYALLVQDYDRLPPEERPEIRE